MSFLTATVAMVAAGFGMSPARTLVGAWFVLRANQVWAPYPDNDPVRARAYMRRFYALVASSGDLPGLDASEAARLEVEWWRVHRNHQRTEDAPPSGTGAPDAGELDLVRALVSLYSYVYGLDRGDVTPAAQSRVLAMRYSDAWVRAGCDRRDPLLTRERAALVGSYQALRAALDRPSG